MDTILFTDWKVKILFLFAPLTFTCSLSVFHFQGQGGVLVKIFQG